MKKMVYRNRCDKDLIPLCSVFFAGRMRQREIESKRRARTTNRIIRSDAELMPGLLLNFFVVAVSIGFCVFDVALRVLESFSHENDESEKCSVFILFVFGSLIQSSCITY